jgi:8-oxo-dGTP diphosphatase
MEKKHAKIMKELSVDCVIFGFDKTRLKVLLIKLNVEPGKGEWALPGGNIRQDENLTRAAQRVLQEHTGVKDLFLEQLSVFGEVDRFPLFRVVTVAYYALVKPELYILNVGPKASEVKWFDISDIKSLPFDHMEILNAAIKKLQKKLRYEPIGFELLSEKFKLTQLQELYESILDTTLDKRNFRKKILSMNLLKPLKETEKGVPHRAARLFSFDKKRYDEFTEKGFNFEI